ncbi:two-component system response regulator PilR (NtrC family) [Variovorax boronicumulans]|uniref:Two-component system response regulator PilR (NtrC family) n=1 Tax=Variovorax boronicumulans TaxID=436515 RepID=A0AAW8DR66_9BURK|nr:sigma-54 dependent transcriptional regulator [Variovorax boronicumulans]MDP9877201.1 two-component system response regulator PilR (NtrC family) [Variovorax boronicumulans]MDP9921922.1 two-component system response regulator PilR (NtrC family) [Variovorax boronicumulans]
MSSLPPSAAAPRPAQILVIDDEPDLRTLYELTLLREGYRVEAAGSVSEAWQHLEAGRFDAVITDMRLPDGEGMEIIHRIQKDQRSERCVVMTAYGSAENAVEALKAGAFDYLTKPVDLKQFRAVVASAVQANRAAVVVPQKAPPQAAGQGGERPDALAVTRSGATALDRLVGDSDPMRLVKSRIAKVARGMAPVLVRGESGTGKELVARAVHGCSQRSEGPFVAVNCGAIPENLLEAEFFGAKKGSYTGSSQDRDGYFQAARDGTLFLDEIGDLPLAMQSKLLRAIQERSVRAIGSTQEDAVDVRIVSATHKDLHAEVLAGRFRQDLFYRLNVIEIAVPALRERREDLPALCTALLARIAQDGGLPVPRLSDALLQRLAQHPLDGNVRELENLLHRAVALNDGDELHIDLMGAMTPMPAAPRGESAEAPAAVAVAPVPAPAVEPKPAPPPLPSDLQAWLDQQEREILVRALHESGFNRTAAAARLGMSLRQIRYRIARLGISTPNGDDGTTAHADD